MSDINEDLEFSHYFQRFLPKDIKIDKGSIFYRDKYNEIINYIKALLTDSDLEFTMFIKPKGTLLINVQPGTDILDFLKLVSSNYYLDYIELINVEKLKGPDDNFKNFIKILERIDKYTEKDETDNDTIKKEAKRNLIVINQPYNYGIDKTLNIHSILHDFVNIFKNTTKAINFIEKNSILVWINYNYEEISSGVFDVFDLLIRIPELNRFERETILRNFSEKNPKIVFDINTILNSTDNWEVKDLNRMLEIAIFKHYINSDLNNVSNEITDSVLSLIETGEFVPSKTIKIIKQQKIGNSVNLIQGAIGQKTEIKERSEQEIGEQESILNEIKDQSISEFMLNQLYENAASKNYNELLIIIDKLKKKEHIEENERKILAKYPFILRDSPNMAHLNLEKAKKRVDLLKKAFGR